MDTKLLDDELYYIDLEKLCFCLSIAIQKHIRFSRGFLFLDDLAAFLKTGKSPSQIIQDNEFTESENELRFSYCFPDQLKLSNFDNTKLNRESKNRSSKETSNIKSALEKNEIHTGLVLPDISAGKNSTANLEAFLQKEGFSKHSSSQVTPSNSSPLKLLNLMQNDSPEEVEHDMSHYRENKFCNPSYSSQQEHDTYEDEIEDVTDDANHASFKLKISKVNNKVSLPAINTKQQNDSDSETSQFYQNESNAGLSPDAKKHRRAKGLHDYQGNKENMINNGFSQEFNKSPMKKRQVDADPCSDMKFNYEESNQKKPFVLPIEECEPLEASSLFESVYIMDENSDKIKQHIKNEMDVFDLAYDIDLKSRITLTEEEKDIIYNPEFEDIFNYVKYVAFKSKMEAEIPIISLIYIEKLLRQCGVLVNIHNWRRIVLITL